MRRWSLADAQATHSHRGRIGPGAARSDPLAAGRSRARCLRTSGARGCVGMVGVPALPGACDALDVCLRCRARDGPDVVLLAKRAAPAHPAARGPGLVDPRVFLDQPGTCVAKPRKRGRKWAAGAGACLGGNLSFVSAAWGWPLDPWTSAGAVPAVARLGS